MADTRFRVALSAAARLDAVTAQVWEGPHAAGPVVVLAHGAGAFLDHPVHQGVCAALARRDRPTVGFNFPYAEQGRRSPDSTPRLLQCFRDVLAWVTDRFGPRPVVAGGRSMGGRMASLLAAEGADLAGLALLNYPLLPSNRQAQARPRVDHWPDVRVPVLFVHGSRDRLIPSDVLLQHQPKLASTAVTVHVVEDADHGFAVPKRAGRSVEDVYDEVATAVDSWLSAAVAR